MDLIHKIESLRYDIENGVETDVIKISVRLIQIKEQALQLQKTGVSGRSEQLATYLQDVIGKKYSIYFEQQDIDGLIEVANCH